MERSDANDAFVVVIKRLVAEAKRCIVRGASSWKTQLHWSDCQQSMLFGESRGKVRQEATETDDALGELE